MKKVKGLLSATLVLFCIWAFSGAAIGSIGVGAGTGVDANGVIFQKGWVSGLDFSSVSTTYTAGASWYENYNDGTNTWGHWFAIADFTDPATYAATGDWYVWSTLTDGAGGLANSVTYDIDDVFFRNWEQTNSVTGYYWQNYTYRDDSGTIGAYYEEIQYTLDPTSGLIDWKYKKYVDIDDGNYGDDWTYEAWKWYKPGEGTGSEGFTFNNYVEGFYQYDSYDYNTVSGFFEIDKEIALDTDLDGDFWDNYSSKYWERYDAGTGWYEKYFEEWDWSAVKYDSAAYYLESYEENRLTGVFRNVLDVRQDTDGDGNWNDYWSWSDFGASSTYREDGFYLENGPYSYSSESIYDSANRQRFEKWEGVYTETGYADGGQNFYWDADGDGNYNDDYYYETSYERNYEGWDYDYVYLQDYVSEYANTYYFSNSRNIYTGDFYTEESKYTDNDLDGDLYDYQEKGAYYSYTESRYESYNAYSWSQSTVWDPAGDYDGVTFGTYQYSNIWSYENGDNYAETQYAKDTDNDGRIENWQGDDLWQTARVRYNAGEGETEESLWSSEDYYNNSGKYQYARVESWSNLAGSSEMEMRTANLAGYVRYEEGRDATEAYSWKESEVRTWGVDRKETGTTAYDAGDSETWSRIDLDIDGDTAWDNTWDYEAYAVSWDNTEGSFRYVGYRTGDADIGDGIDFEYNYYNETYSPHFDSKQWRYAEVDPGVGGYDGWSNYFPREIAYSHPYPTNAWEQEFRYASGAATPYYGTYRKYNETPDPYSYENYLYTAETGTWYLFIYNI